MQYKPTQCICLTLCKAVAAPPSQARRAPPYPSPPISLALRSPPPPGPLTPAFACASRQQPANLHLHCNGCASRSSSLLNVWGYNGMRNSSLSTL